MVSRRRFKSVLAAIGLYILAALLIGYFGVNAVTGNRGLKVQHDLERQIAELSGEIEKLREEKAQWQRRVALLRSDNLDPDMLDERARALLDYVHKQDVILLLKPR
jgi:cell division protein FtsB